MLISEKQLLNLITIIATVSSMPEFSFVLEESKQQMRTLLSEIGNQQLTDLKEIK